MDNDKQQDFALNSIEGIDDVNVVPAVAENSNLKLPQADEAKLYTDGGSRGNPGPSAIGYVLYGQNDEIIEEFHKFIGVTTNNQAEYQALKAGLECSRKHGIKKLQVYMDSMLVVNQVQGIWKIKNSEFLGLTADINKLIEQFEEVKISHIPRALNSKADSLVNQSLDEAAA